jgi:hypothetical protein
VADVVLAMGLLQVVRGQTVSAGFVQQVIDTLVLPAVHATTDMAITSESMSHKSGSLTVCAQPAPDEPVAVAPPRRE